ncbi:MAG: hypothetical protein PHY46_05460, partial [Candidatus Omnitrophica bacterium]|nr:hypothetical protein [Candidatus Omnitrophota bacterium]
EKTTTASGILYNLSNLSSPLAYNGLGRNSLKSKIERISGSPSVIQNKPSVRAFSSPLAKNTLSDSENLSREGVFVSSPVKQTQHYNYSYRQPKTLGYYLTVAVSIFAALFITFNIGRFIINRDSIKERNVIIQANINEFKNSRERVFNSKEEMIAYLARLSDGKTIELVGHYEKYAKAGYKLVAETIGDENGVRSVPAPYAWHTHTIWSYRNFETCLPSIQDLIFVLEASESIIGIAPGQVAVLTNNKTSQNEPFIEMLKKAEKAAERFNAPAEYREQVLGQIIHSCIIAHMPELSDVFDVRYSMDKNYHINSAWTIARLFGLDYTQYHFIYDEQGNIEETIIVDFARDKAFESLRNEIDKFIRENGNRLLKDFDKNVPQEIKILPQEQVDYNSLPGKAASSPLEENAALKNYYLYQELTDDELKELDNLCIDNSWLAQVCRKGSTHTDTTVLKGIIENKTMAKNLGGLSHALCPKCALNERLKYNLLNNIDIYRDRALGQENIQQSQKRIPLKINKQSASSPLEFGKIINELKYSLLRLTSSQRQQTLREIEEKINNINVPLIVVFDIDDTLICNNGPKVKDCHELIRMLRQHDNVLVGIVTDKLAVVQEDIDIESVSEVELVNALSRTDRMCDLNDNYFVKLGVTINDFDFFVSGVTASSKMYRYIRAENRLSVIPQVVNRVVLADKRHLLTKIASLVFVDRIFTSDFKVDLFKEAYLVVVGDHLLLDHSLTLGESILPQHQPITKMMQDGLDEMGARDLFNKGRFGIVVPEATEKIVEDSPEGEVIFRFTSGENIEIKPVANIPVDVLRQNNIRFGLREAVLSVLTAMQLNIKTDVVIAPALHEDTEGKSSSPIAKDSRGVKDVIIGPLGLLRFSKNGAYAVMDYMNYVVKLMGKPEKMMALFDKLLVMLAQAKGKTLEYLVSVALDVYAPLAFRLGLETKFYE